MGFILPKKAKWPKKWIFLLCNEGHASPRFPGLGPLPFSHQIICQYGVHFAKKTAKLAKKWIFLLCNEGQASPRFPVLGLLPFSHQLLGQYGVHFAKKWSNCQRKWIFVTKVRKQLFIISRISALFVK